MSAHARSVSAGRRCRLPAQAAKAQRLPEPLAYEPHPGKNRLLRVGCVRARRARMCACVRDAALHGNLRRAASDAHTAAHGVSGAARRVQRSLGGGVRKGTLGGTQGYPREYTRVP